MRCWRGNSCRNRHNAPCCLRDMRIGVIALLNQWVLRDSGGSMIQCRRLTRGPIPPGNIPGKFDPLDRIIPWSHSGGEFHLWDQMSQCSDRLDRMKNLRHCLSVWCLIASLATYVSYARQKLIIKYIYEHFSCSFAHKNHRTID